ncbi:sensor histidine kinase [Paraburkholderia sp. BCC1884]|uniref:sensor histidine kinase n=1 Tax=Paraburkholderia sp. BCC1884 TaxID=2562668 RepID=UPI0011845569|nr:ATP-binding protein [Paraburkholderia sp. BCC1884]
MNGSRENQEPVSPGTEPRPSDSKKEGRRTHSRETTDAPAGQVPGFSSTTKVISRIDPTNEFVEDLQAMSMAGFFGWNTRTGELTWSNVTYEIFGFDPGTDLVLADVYKRIREEDVVLLRQALDDPADKEEGPDLRLRLTLPGGNVKYVRVRAHPERRDPSSGQYVGVAMDITSSALSELELNTSRQELAQKKRPGPIGEVGAWVAHDLAQPLSSIVMNGQACIRWMSMGTAGTEEARSCVQRIVSSGYRATDIIQQIRRLASGEKPATAPIFINELVESTEALLGETFEKNHITCTSSLAPGLPTISGDRTQLQQVLINLLNNAVQSLADVGDRKRKIFIATRMSEGKELLVMVEDSGTGFRVQDLPLMFSPFFTTKADGMGMGLAICRTVVEAHCGRLWALNNTRHGATFYFTLPAAP